MANEKLYVDKWIEIEFDPENNWLYANWQDIQTFESIVNGGTQMLKHTKAKGCSVE